VKETISKVGERLRAIDALRGGAALGVVLYHEVGAKPYPESKAIWNWFFAPVWATSSFGYAGVFLFFVISGFCIHLQWAKRRLVEDNVQLEFKPFWKRRIWRLYPPYLMALAIYLMVSGFTTEFRVSALYIWDLILHLLMLHNCDPRTTYSINGVFWTLAIEEQLYLAYFLLIFLRNRFGWKRTLLICAATRVGWLIVVGGLQGWFGLNLPLSEGAASHWFTWALGALAVEGALGLVSLPRWCSRASIGLLALLSAVGLTQALPQLESNGILHNSAWLILHPLWGVAFFVIVNCFVSAEKKWRPTFRTPAIVRALAFVGLFSYSLYLTHELVLMEAYRFERLGLSEWFVAIAIMTPATLLFAWIFFICCERPVLTKPVVGSSSSYEPKRVGDNYVPVPTPAPLALLGSESTPDHLTVPIFAKIAQK
jgi:peptidoglycan/LPS O-acetylase OafA/YrhL